MSNFGSYDNLLSLFTKLKTSLTKRPKTWTGTTTEWNAMTPAQKAEYDGWYVNFTDDAEEGGGGAGGHVIEDSEGITLTQRDTIHVGGSLIAEDDSTNEKTIITDGMQTIDYEDWIALTPQEQAAIPKAVITNAPDNPRNGSVSVTADGVKTYATILNELYGLADLTKISAKSYIDYCNVNYHELFSLQIMNANSVYVFACITSSASGILAEIYTVRSSSSSYEDVYGSTVTNKSTQVPVSGRVFTLYY